MSMKLGAFAVVVCSTLIAVTGCTAVTATNPANSNGGGSSSATPSEGGGGGTAAPTPITPKQACDAVITCVGACPANDTTCEDACVAEGSPSAQDKYNALNSCILESECTDAECVQSVCATAINACLEDVPPSSPNPNPNPQNPSGPLSQQDLVGTWENVDPAEGMATSFTFNADGTYRKVYVYVNPSSTCTYFQKRTIVDDGTMKVAGDTLELSPNETLQTMIHCSGQESGKKTMSMNDKFTFVSAGSALTLTDTFTNKTVTFTKK